jgi:hypothetical protein
MAKRVSFVKRKTKGGKKKGGSTDFPFGANVASGKRRRRSGFGGGS